MCVLKCWHNSKDAPLMEGFVGFKARNTSWAQIWQSSKNIVCGFVAGNLAKSYEQLLEYEKVFMSIRSFKKIPHLCPEHPFSMLFSSPPTEAATCCTTLSNVGEPQWMCGYQTIHVAGFLFVQSWYHSSQRFIQDVFVYILGIPQPKNLKIFLSNSGYSCLCEASRRGEWPLPLLPRLGLSATATPEELKRLGAEKMVQIVISWCMFFFTPILGEMIQSDEPIFQMGCIMLQCSLEGVHMQSLHGSGMGPWLIWRNFVGWWWLEYF